MKTSQRPRSDKKKKGVSGHVSTEGSDLDQEHAGLDLTRRDFLGGTGAAIVAAKAAPLKAQEPRQEEVEPEVADVPKTVITVTVNGIRHSVEVEDRWTLNELLRDHIGLIGSKIGCNRGECGACTVLLDGEPVYSCSTLAVWADPRSLATTSGIISFPPGTKMFQFPGFPSHAYVFSMGCARFTHTGFPIRKSTGINVCTRLPEAYRSVLRPSSALNAKASTICP